MESISIIIPIFGVEKYIERCARSIFEQSFKSIEYIFVNDCTQDRSIEILNDVIADYPNRKEQIKIIQQPQNMGLPSARKKGVEVATGTYIIHCDSDDWMEKDMCTKMYEKALSTSADIVICDFYISTDEGSIRRDPEVMLNQSSKLFTNVGMWQKLVKADLYKNLKFYPVSSMWEDRVFTIQLAYFADRVEYLTEPLYHYYMNDSGICRSQSREKIIDRFNGCVKNLNLIRDFISLHNIRGVEPFLLDLKRQALMILAPATNEIECYRLWRNSFPELHSTILSSNVRLIEKIKYVVAYLRLYPLIKRVFSNI